MANSGLNTNDPALVAKQADWLRTWLATPEGKAATAQAGTSTVKVPPVPGAPKGSPGSVGRELTFTDGAITHVKEGGSVWGPLLLAGAIAATGGLAGVYAAGAAGGSAAVGGGAAAAGGGAAAAGGGGAAAAGGTTAAGIGGAALRYGAPIAGNLVNGIIQSRASSDAADEQQKYLQQALDYEKEKDAYQRGVDQQAVAREESRYAGYQDRIRGFIDNGQSSNDRMASLLGLPARPGGGGGGGRGGDSGAGYTPSQTPQAKAAWAGFDALFPGETLTPAMLKAKEAELKALGFTLRPNAKGEVGKIQYGTDRIADVIQGAGTGVNKKQQLYGGPPPGGDLPQSDPRLPSAAPVRAAMPPTSVTAPSGIAVAPSAPMGASSDGIGINPGVRPPPMPTAAPPPAPARTPAPAAAMPTAMVTVIAPTGQSKQVPASQAAYWQAKGATVQGTA